MGITNLSIQRLQKHDLIKGSMLQLGCQNLYFEPVYEHLAHTYFQEKGVDIDTWDISGCQGAKIVDLRILREPEKFYDVITDFGTGEHVDGGVL